MKKITNPGRMNERISFYKAGPVQDGGWSGTTPKALQHECAAAIRTQFLKELQATIGTVLENTTTFIVRYRQRVEVKSDWTLEHKGSSYEIVQINPDHANKDYTIIIAKQVS